MLEIFERDSGDAERGAAVGVRFDFSLKIF